MDRPRARLRLPARQFGQVRAPGRLGGREAALSVPSPRGISGLEAASHTLNVGLEADS